MTRISPYNPKMHRMAFCYLSFCGLAPLMALPPDIGGKSFLTRDVPLRLSLTPCMSRADPDMSPISLSR